MKKILFIGLLSFIFLSTSHAQYRTERTGYEGDFFSLEGAIELFKEAHSIKDFERKINSKHTYVNNLDLNYDGRIDFIRVRHRRQGDFHAIILQVPIDKYDIQDVAVIEIEKVGRRNAVLQIIGDPDLYGEEVIVEPYATTGYSSSRGNANANYVSNDYVNVYYWPLVQYILAPRYIVYNSPYRWSYYPTWWSPWRPYSWYVYHPRIRHYHRHCHVVTIYRSPRVHRFYKPHRSHSHHVARQAEKIRIQRGKTYGHHSAVRENKTLDSYGAGSRKVIQQPERMTTKRQTQRGTSASTHATPRVNQPSRSTSTQKRSSTFSSKSKASNPKSQPSAINRDQVRKKTSSSTRPATPRVTNPSEGTSPKYRTKVSKEKAVRNTSPQHRVNKDQARERVTSGSRPGQTRANKPTRNTVVPKQRTEVNKQRTIRNNAQPQRINTNRQRSQRSYPSTKRSTSNVKKSTRSVATQKQQSPVARKKAAPSRPRKR
jgi:hypothetical protein